MKRTHPFYDLIGNDNPKSIGVFFGLEYPSTEFILELLDSEGSENIVFVNGVSACLKSHSVEDSIQHVQDHILTKHEKPFIIVSHMDWLNDYEALMRWRDFICVYNKCTTLLVFENALEKFYPAIKEENKLGMNLKRQLLRHHSYLDCAIIVEAVSTVNVLSRFKLRGALDKPRCVSIYSRTTGARFIEVVNDE